MVKINTVKLYGNQLIIIIYYQIIWETTNNYYFLCKKACKQSKEITIYDKFVRKTDQWWLYLPPKHHETVIHLH